MFKIAVCDDDINHSFKLEEYILEAFKKFSINVEVDVYEKLISLLNKFEDGKVYTILFLDIEMPRLSGIDLAKK